MIFNKLNPFKSLFQKSLTRPFLKPQTPLSLLNKPILRLCSTSTDKIPVNIVEENNSWSYEFDESEIKGISYSSASGNYIIIYTCKVCETRQSRSFTKNAYHTGVVIVRCEGCENLHLIADNLKWFEEEGVNVEDLVRRENNEVVRIEAKGEMKEYLFNKLKKRETEAS